MRIIIFALLLLPVFGLAQKNNVLIKLTDARGQQIKGEALLKGFEKWINAATISSAGKNNTQLSFTMAISGASADLKKAMTTGELLLSGQVTVLSPNETAAAPLTVYTIKMERIAVTSCAEAMGCNNVMTTTVTLQATRIGWTYYDQARSGAQVVSRKF